MLPTNFYFYNLSWSLNFHHYNMPVSVSRRPQEDSMTTTRACLTRWRLTIENTDLKWKSKIRIENSNSIEYPNHIKDPNPERRYDTCSLLSSGGKLLRSLAKVSTFCFQPNNLFSCRLAINDDKFPQTTTSSVMRLWTSLGVGTFMRSAIFCKKENQIIICH